MQAGKLITAKEAERRVLVLENPGLHGQVADHQLALCRPAAHPAGRGGAGAPPFAVGAALHRRGQRRLHRRRRREDDHAARRLRHHAVLDLARPRQRQQRADGVDGRARHPDRRLLRRAVRRGLSAGEPAGRRGPRAMRSRATAAACCRSATSARCRPRRSSTIPIPARASRWSRCARAEAWDPCHGLKLRYVNPVDGGWAMPTIGTFMQLLPKGMRPCPTARPTAPCSRSSRARRPTSPASATQRLRLGAARHVRRAELAVAPPRDRRRRGAVQLLGPAGAGQARPVARDARQPRRQRQGA